MMKLSTAILIFLTFFTCVPAMAQVYSPYLEERVKNEGVEKNARLKFPSEVKEFYVVNGFRLSWIGNTSNLDQLRCLIGEASDHGLMKEDYPYSDLLNFQNRQVDLSNEEDLVNAEFLITDAAIHFFHDLVFGNRSPSFGYAGIKVAQNCFNLSRSLIFYLSNYSLADLANDIENSFFAYRTIKMKLSQYNKRFSDTAFSENVPITSTTVTNLNRPLIRKLYQLGVLDSMDLKIPDKDLREKLKDAQRLFYLPEDGVMRSNLLYELNISLERRMSQLVNALNFIRWTRCLRDSELNFIVVNLPSADLLVFEGDSVVLSSKVVAGTRTTPSSTLSSEITEVILFPYWYVPRRIATRELLPLIKKNVGFLEANSFQVLDGRGKVVNPQTIAWETLNETNFPYTLRQSTGCDNSLGVIKLNFYSPFGIYLHDTPWKGFFNSRSRFFSHGCIRVEKAIELASLVLNEKKEALDVIKINEYATDQKPITVQLDKSIPLLIIYHTAWIDSSGTVRFYPDIYKREAYRKK